MNKIKKGLGRGLSSLIGETKVETKTNKLSLSEIVPNKFQPRKNFDEENLNDLTNSIKERGVIQPIIVRKSYSDNAKFDTRVVPVGIGPNKISVIVSSFDDQPLSDISGVKVKISKLAQGLPVGGEIESLDDGTLIYAFKNRNSFTKD